MGIIRQSDRVRRILQYLHDKYLNRPKSPYFQLGNIRRCKSQSKGVGPARFHIIELEFYLPSCPFVCALVDFPAFQYSAEGKSIIFC